METAALTARYVFPVSGPPIAGGVVSVAGGRIVSVGDKPGLRPLRDLGNVALLPGLVNAHTHLEFSLLKQPLGDPQRGFCPWIREVVEWRRSRSEQPADAIIAGMGECLAAQTALVGEIASQHWPVELSLSPDRSPSGCAVFLELLGLARARWPSLIDAARQHLEQPSPPGLSRGLSPHAPYTAAPELVKAAVEIAASHGAPVATHLAETVEELELLASHSGPMRTLLEDLQAWHADAIPRGIRPLDYLKLLAGAPRSLVIHGNYLTTAEIEYIAAQSQRMSVVYCPRTHAYFRHTGYPLAKLLASGVNVALGTDSRASSADLNLWAEAQFAAASHPGVSPAAIVRMATLAGAVALGRESDFGALEPGRVSAFCIVPLPDHQASDPYELLFTKPTA